MITEGDPSPRRNVTFKDNCHLSQSQASVVQDISTQSLSEGHPFHSNSTLVLITGCLLRTLVYRYLASLVLKHYADATKHADD